jgi:hypothetical protein
MTGGNQMILSSIFHFSLCVVLINFNACNQQFTVHPETNVNPPFKTGRLKLISPLNTVRSVHTATLLNDGKVLLAGGMNNNETALQSAEIFDPQTNKFTMAANMNYPRVGHTAVLLKDGKVLLAGGYTNRKPSATAEIYNPQTKQFLVVGEMKIARGGHTATLLEDGRILVAGSEKGEKICEIFDPQTQKFTESGNLSISRFAHTATLLNTGEVLISGGGNSDDITRTAEIFNPKTGKLTLTGEMSVVRYKHSAILLNNGNVLIVGGSDSRDWDGQYSSAEIYQTNTGKFKNTSEMSVKRFKIATALAMQKNGQILVAGGNEAFEIFDQQTETFKLIEEKTDAPKFYTTTILLSTGNILIVDGYDRSIKSQGKAFIFAANK